MPRSRRLTAAELTRLASLDMRDRLQVGQLAYLRQQAQPGSAQRSLLDRMYQRAVATQPHAVAPALTDPTRPHRTGVRQQGLTPSDHAWIARLPADPTEISDDDLRTLSGMRGNTRESDVSDRRLLDSILGPAGRAWRERAEAAHAEAVRARQPLLAGDEGAGVERTQERRQLVESLTHALGEQIGLEVPELDESEARTRARNLVDRAVADARVARSAELATVEPNDAA